MTLNRRLTIAICLALPQLAEAQPVAETEEIVVTGTRTAQLALESPVRVDVLGKDLLQALHAHELTEAVDTVPGINVRQVVGKNGQEAWLQGISANRVLILVDGEPVSASTGSAVDMSQVSVGNIERVEIVKGATSVLYGSAAMGGVINIITDGLRPGLHYRVSVDGGSYGEQNPSGNEWDITRQRLNAAVTYGGERWQNSFSLNGRFSDGFQENPDAWSQQGADGHKINAEWKLAYTPDDDSRYRLRYEYYDQKQHNRLLEFTPPANYNLLHKYDDAIRQHLSLSGNWRLGNSDLRIHGFVEQYDNESQPKGTFRRDMQLDTKKISTQWDGELNDKHLLTIGMDLFSETLEQKKTQANGIEIAEIPGGSRDSIELYLQDDMTLGQWNVLPGLRWQHDSDFGDKLTPKVNAYRPLWQSGDNSMAMRIGVGQGYRVSNLKERYYEFDHSHLGYRIIGNAELDPESSTSYQFAWLYREGRRHDLEINFFYNDLTDLIEAPLAYTASDGIDIYQYTNIAEASTQGIELNWSWRPAGNIHWRNGYTWLRAMDQSTGEPLPERPRHQVRSVLDADLTDTLRMTLIARWQSDEYISDDRERSPAWGNLDIKLNQYLGYGLRLYGGIDNINNVQRDFSNESDNRPVEGRLVYIGFTIEH